MMLTETETRLAALLIEELTPPCESSNPCNHAPAVGIVFAYCLTCGFVEHLLCAHHFDRLVMRSGELFIHPTCGTRDTGIIRLERL